MGKQRKDPRKEQELEIAEADVDEVGGGDVEIDEIDDFDHFLETLDDSSDSEGDDDEADPSQEDGLEVETSDDDDEDENMEPEEDEDLNEDEEESEENDEDEQESSDDQVNAEEGEEGAPLQNGIGGLGGASSESENDEEETGKKGMTAKKHKMDLQKLQETDPEFFNFLKQNDAELLDFNDSDDDGSDSDEEDALHKPPETLEEASDSEAEEERFDGTTEEHKSKVQKHLKKGIVDINVIAHWESQLSGTREISVLGDVIDALQCAVDSLVQGEESGGKWKVTGSANFNALIRLCVKEVKGFCVRFLCGNNNVAISEKNFDQKPFEVRDKSKQKWTRLRPKMKSYMEIIIQLFKCLGNPDAVASVLKHCLRMSGFWALFATKSYKMLRSLVNIWSQKEDACRVLAFLAIIRITNYSKDVFLLHMFKQMYISYVANCKFTSVNTWPAINFMRSSLVELYLLDTSLAYSVAFPFIRQLAIHLRNALSPNAVQSDGKLKKSEASRVVYSWQFVHSLHLWVDVLAQAGSNEDENLKLLIYPVVQICMGTIKLIPTKKFIPLRFHIVRMMIKLQDKTGSFIPVLPLITEVLRLTEFSNKGSKFSVRPIDLSVCLKADASESGYTKAVSENTFETILAYCKAIGTDLGFPEIVTPTVMYLKTFVKKQCKNIEVIKKFKALLEKIEANTKYINEKRNKALEDGTVTLADKKSHKILQVQMQTTKPHPPILAYAAEYFKVNQKVQIKSIKPALETREEKLIPKPTVLKQSKGKRANSKDNEFDKPMFESDSEEDDAEFATKLDDVAEAETEKKKKKKRKIPADEDNDDEDDVETQQPEKKKKKKKVKAKKAKKIELEASDDVQDELVDFELSD
ncbi:Nucleolar complex protein 2 [Orchesella cincta]|uniref:Nucleolar complex protein 2 n=1 Tax=Orchesella cincta TaxID=48709 RepID=A0A1D2NMZ7_ORCCI|nr:Nucleolar complex protein 2 [Orchesella cincta]